MNVRQYIRPDIAVSAIAHLSVLALVFVFSEVHPFGAVTAEPIAVDIVRLDEIATKVEPDLQLQLPSSDIAAGSKPGAPAAQPAPAESVQPPPQQQPAGATSKEAALQQKQQQQQKQAKAQAQQPPQAAPPQPQPQATQQSPPPPPQPAPSPSLGYTPAEPDLTIKYNVMLGLPEDMLVTPPKSAGDKTQDKSGDGGDATASTKADVSSTIIEEFRRHLKTCSKLPASVAPSEKVMVKLRVIMTPEGRLATEPILMAATASDKGPLLMQSAIKALSSCQPYTMLPPNRYGEWKVLDLSFTPDDFS
jgi:outer membrane biosynthesis protein TonB